jgi:hypothetical protein
MNPFDIMCAYLYNRNRGEFEYHDISFLTNMAVNHHHVASVLVHKIGAGIVDGGEE